MGRGTEEKGGLGREGTQNMGLGWNGTMHKLCGEEGKGEKCILHLLYLHHLL